MKSGGVCDVSYPTSKLRRGRVQGGGDISPTLTCGNNAIVKIDVEEIEMEKTELGMEVENEKGISGEVLCLLRKTIGEKEFSEWAFRGICYFLQKEVLRQRMYATGLLEDWRKQSEFQQFSYYSQNDKWLDITEESMRDLWQDWQARCSPYRSQFSEQQLKQLDDFMQKLPHEDAQAEECLQSLWEACEGLGVLQQALHQVQEAWKSANKVRYRIRKLTPLETWRLQNFTDEDFRKAEAVNSNSQLYRQSGNSICVSVLCAIFSQLGIQGHKRWNEMSLEERRELVYKGTILEGKKEC